MIGYLSIVLQIVKAILRMVVLLLPFLVFHFDNIFNFYRFSSCLRLPALLPLLLLARFPRSTRKRRAGPHPKGCAACWLAACCYCSIGASNPTTPLCRTWSH